MNTRIQVEHTVTEMVTGLDLVREQVLIAAGEPLTDSPGGRGSARARDRVSDQRRRPVERASCPTPGRITSYREPGGPGVRVDSGVEAGAEVGGLLRPARRQARRPRGRSRACAAAHAARARRVRDRRRCRRCSASTARCFATPCFVGGGNVSRSRRVRGACEAKRMQLSLPDGSA